jgi:hypothetical protein
MKAATVEETIGHGIRTQTLLLTSTAGISDPSKKKQTQHIIRRDKGGGGFGGGPSGIYSDGLWV